MLINNKKHNILHNYQKHNEKNKIFGFWIYLMSDCILFAALFAAYCVLKNNICSYPAGKDIFKLNIVFFETLFLLLSSLTCAISILSIDTKCEYKIIFWLILTLILGLSFIFIEFYELHKLINLGFIPQKSAFLSSFFTLLIVHVIHVLSGIIWILILIFALFKYKLTLINITRLYCFSLFWHFLDIIWICLYTIVYLIGLI